MNFPQLLDHTVLRDMNPADLAGIVCIEQRVHACPWSCGNFTDALNSNYVCKVCEAEGDILGYVVFMPALDEAHLLNIGIAVLMSNDRKKIKPRLIAWGLGLQIVFAMIILWTPPGRWLF